MVLRSILGVALAACWYSLAHADIVWLANGGRVEGKVLNPDESPRTTYIIQFDDGGTLKLAEADVDRVTVQSELERRYEEVLPTLADTESAHWDMAAKCEKAGLKEQREFHLEQVLRHNPEHEPARYALGYSRVGGKWQRQADFMEAQGYVRYRGAWRLPQEITLDERQTATEGVTVEWRRKVQLWRSWIVKGRDNAGQGQTNLKEIRDPQAAEALADALREENDPRLKQALKLLYIDVLSRLDSGAAHSGFVWAGLNDADAQVREKALEALAATGSPLAIAAFVKALQSDDNRLIHRAAVALSYMRRPEATTLPLIDALITEHKRTVGGGGIQPTFSGNGSGGLSMGGKPQVIKVKVQNEPVLHALSALYPGTNFGFDQDAWRKWYVARHTPREVDLRRGQ